METEHNNTTQNCNCLGELQNCKIINNLECKCSCCKNGEYNHLKFSNTIQNFPICFKYAEQIKSIICTCYNLIDIQHLPPKLETLRIFNSNLNNINTNIPITLNELYITNAQIKYINVSNTNIKILTIKYNKVNLSIKCPKKLETLNLNYTKIKQILLPLEVINLSLNCCGLDKLPKLPSTIQILHIYGNNISNIDNLPDNITFLKATDNKIKTVKKFPSKLIKLEISANKLRELVNLPNSLETIVCCSNNIRRIVTSSFILNYINCNDNPLKYVNVPGLKNLYYNIS
jgi:hypothetical protein